MSDRFDDLEGVCYDCPDVSQPGLMATPVLQVVDKVVTELSRRTTMT